MNPQPTQNKPLTRDQMHRCPVCRKLWPDAECQLDPVLGYICPKGCTKPYVQLPYDSPMQDDEQPENSPKKVQ